MDSNFSYGLDNCCDPQIGRKVRSGRGISQRHHTFTPLLNNYLKVPLMEANIFPAGTKHGKLLFQQWKRKMAVFVKQ